MRWFTKASEAGLPKAMFFLGWMLDKGVGVVAPDYPAAADWYRRAADAGVEESPKAMFFLGLLLEGFGRVGQGGDGGQGEVAPDYPAAADWYR